MSTPSTPSRLSLRPQAKATVPVRSPRTSIILAELTRQRRDERRRRRRKRQQRRRAWAWLTALGQGRSGSFHPQAALGLFFVGATPLVYALQPSW